MGNVIQLFGPREPQPVDWEEFTDEIASQRVLQSVQAELDDAVGQGRVNATRPYLAQKEGMGSWGTFHHVHTMNRIVTHENYPNYLIDNKLDRTEALSVAASSVVAYTSLGQWAAGLTETQRNVFMIEGNRKSVLPRRPAIWQLDAYDPRLKRQTAVTILHRAAARIALKVSGAGSLRVNQQSELPIHIAALADPLNVNHLRTIQYSADNAWR